jgi:glycosyltransferase involved in cell wall biosynthesis
VTTTKVSVVIPAYNNAEFLGETIQSVLDQTYPNFEVIVVNDASPDDTYAVVSQFHDPRLRYIAHEKNQGLSAARNTGIRASVGELIALLDGDDLFHPEKLQAHVEFLEQHPEVGVTYNARFELNHSASTIRELWRPPATVCLVDLIFGFPFSPSDMVLRREWAFRVDMFDVYYVYVGEDLDINCRLALAECKFASVDRALNYRRYHSGRVIKDIRNCVEYTMRPMNSAFADPRCPKEVLALRDRAFANHLLLWSAIAFTQNETALGQEYCLAAVRGDPSFLSGQPNRLLTTLISASIVDESQDHDQLLRRMIKQLPPELSGTVAQCDWAVARGYLLRGTRAVMWGRAADGRKHFERAAALNAHIDEAFMQQLTAQLLDYEKESGPEALQDVLQNLSPYLERVGNRSQVRWLKGLYLINQAFRSYRAGHYTQVPIKVIHACANDPKYLANRGVLSILLRSIAGMRPQPND